MMSSQFRRKSFALSLLVAALLLAGVVSAAGAAPVSAAEGDGTAAVSVVGCVSDAVAAATAEAHGGEVVAAEGYTPKAGRDVSIDRDGFFWYSLPEGCYPVEPRLDEVFQNEQAFVLRFDDGAYYYFTSWAVYDEPECFPGLAEYLIMDGDITAKITHLRAGFGDVVVGQRTARDDTGQPLYLTMFFWGLDDDKLLCVEVASTKRNHAEMDSFILQSIQGSVDAKNVEWDTDPGWVGEPTPEELDQAMHELYDGQPDANEAWGQYVQDQQDEQWVQENENPYNPDNLGPVLP